MSYGIQEALEQMQALADAGRVDEAVELGQSASDTYNENPSPGGADVGNDQYQAENPSVQQFLQQADAANPAVQWYNGPVSPQQAAPFIPPPGFNDRPVGPQQGQAPAASQTPAAPPKTPAQPAPTPGQSSLQNPQSPLNQPTSPMSQQLADPQRRQEVLKEFLEAEPYLILNHAQNALRRRGASQMFQSWFNQNFNRFLGEYQGMLAEQALRGEIPTVSFVDYVLGLNLDQERAAGSNISQPGVQSNRFASYVRSAGAATR